MDIILAVITVIVGYEGVRSALILFRARRASNENTEPREESDTNEPE
jgi:hypothetical protein